VNSGEYKVMGLAPYGQPKYVDRIFDKLVELQGRRLASSSNMAYFNYLAASP
jgi:carbamoyltransferase